jgi:MFS family permease
MLAERRSLVPELLRRNAPFRTFWAAESVSLVGDQISFLALPLVAVLALGAGPAEMGYLTAANLVPSLLFSLHAGAWADRRGDRRRLMIATDLGRAALLGSIPAAYAVDLLSMAQLYVVAFLVGSLSVLFWVSYNTLFVALLDRDDYVSGGSLLNGSRALSFMAGPSIGGRSRRMRSRSWPAPFCCAASIRPSRSPTRRRRAACWRASASSPATRSCGRRWPPPPPSTCSTSCSSRW